MANEITAKFYTRMNGSEVYYLRIVIPKELRVFVVKPAMWRSLSTKDVKEAQNKALALSLATQRLLQEIADEFLEARTVEMNIDVGVSDLATALEAIETDDVEASMPAMRKALGMKEDKAAANEKPASSAKKSTKKAKNKPSAAKSAKK